MGALRIQVFPQEKALEVLGAVAFGESVPVTVAFQDDAPDGGDFRLRIRFMGADVAAFPLLDEQGQTTDEWEAGTATGEWITSPAMTLNTTQLRACFPPNPPDGMRIQALVMLDCTTSGGETLHAEGRLPILWWAANQTMTPGELPAPIDMAAAYAALDERMTDAEGDIDALETAVEDKADSSHLHIHSDITDFTSAVQTVIPVGSSIIQNDSNPVSGGAIYTALAGAKAYTDAAKDAAKDYADTQDEAVLSAVENAYVKKSDIDSSIDAASTNPVQNKVVKAALDLKADLEDGKVPSSQLPSYVDDVIEGYFYNSKFYKESAHTTEITPEGGKIYVDLTEGKTYRWGGSAYAVISETLAIGETASTAFAGNRGVALEARGYITISGGHIQAVIP